MAPVNAPGAVASLVMGILAFVTVYLGVVFAPLALVFGYKAKRRIDQNPAYAGSGMALAGRIMGWIWMGLAGLVIVAAVVFVLVTQWTGEPAN